MRLYDLLDVINRWDLVTIRMAYDRELLVEEEASVRALKTLTSYHITLYKKYSLTLTTILLQLSQLLSQRRTKYEI